MNHATLITLSTVRLVCRNNTGASTGTGYFYSFKVVHNGEEVGVPAIVTNKHVVDGFNQLEIVLQLMPRGGKVAENGTTQGEIRYPVTIDGFHRHVVRHPDPHVDLCVILVGQLFPRLPSGYDLKIFPVSREWHLNAAESDLLRPIEPIAMIGYPNGLWDEVNNRPIARQGLTASHALQHWNGRRQFVIDAACFPGSSGSPVFLFEDGVYRSHVLGYTPGTRAKLLGTLWGGPLFTAEGRLEPRAIPTSTRDVPVTQLMMNLGFVIHAAAIDDLVPEISMRL